MLCFQTARSADDLFDDADEDLFKEKPNIASLVNHATKESKEVVLGEKVTMNVCFLIA